MKLFFIVITVLFFSLNSCKNKMELKPAAKPETTERPIMVKVDTSGKEFSSKYVCPMHCKGSGSDQPGVCPECGMDYELNEK